MSGAPSAPNTTSGVPRPPGFSRRTRHDTVDPGGSILSPLMLNASSDIVASFAARLRSSYLVNPHTRRFLARVDRLFHSRGKPLRLLPTERSEVDLDRIDPGF